MVLNASAHLESRYVGEERQPLLTIDNLLAQPAAWVEKSLQSSFTKPAGSAYPGLNAPLPPTLALSIAESLKPILAKGYGLNVSKGLSVTGFFALATTPADALTPLQSIPHFDSIDPHRVACVLYLCKPGYGGTAFYRHSATGYETIDLERVARFAGYAKREMADVPVGYVGPATPHFEEIDQVDAVYNRLVVYRNNAFHAASLGTGTLSDDPATGRLTANLFLQAATASS